MAETKYGKYIITEPKPMKRPSGAPVISVDDLGWQEVMRIDDEWVKGSFYLACVWIWKKAGDAPPIKPHVHDWEEYIGFFGTNPDDPKDLCGEIEFWLGGEKHMLTKSCVVFIPKGVEHCPIITRRADRPIFSFSTGPQSVYDKEVKE
jgi:hypothetical protein